MIIILVTLKWLIISNYIKFFSKTAKNERKLSCYFNFVEYLNGYLLSDSLNTIYVFIKYKIKSVDLHFYSQTRK